MHVALATLLAGCTPGDDEGTPAPADTGSPPLDYRDAAPQWTADEAVAHAAEVFGYGWPAPLEPLGAFNLLMSFGDEACPGNELAYIDTLDGCWAESGHWYMGLGKFEYGVVRQESESGEEIWKTDLRTVNGDFEILAPDGREYTAGGSMELTRTLSASGGSAMATTRGSWHWTGSEHAWFKAGISAELRTYAQIGAGGDAEVGDVVVINGTYGIDHHYLYFDQYTLGGDCGWQPSGGAIALRQDDQSTTTLTFAEDCSGCATVTWEGEALGEACVDWAAYGADIATTTLGAL